MKEQTRNTLIIFAVVAAVLGVLILKQYNQQQFVTELRGDEIVGAGKPAMLELGSHECNACKEMMPVIDELAKRYGEKVAVGFVDVKAEESYQEKYDLSRIPTQIFFDGEGNEVFRHIGFYPLEDIVEKWAELGVELSGVK
ncbi:Thioredoxin [Anaerohalosphaera lusitana]|uniref:Thioredoxin n=1 Tax=Anaerohalosphaera lusitana TaxID=1936003 RepID=A0A1U9NHR2_9BACT|nr:thioredoxin family protein [Anaerohalosphaera lusitana]AQT67140.1 Thioredoxin [Anaerohalosphaera lusitana]